MKPDLLCLHPWSFALKWQDLQQYNITPDDPRYSYAYHLPADYINIWQTYPGLSDYQIIRDRIVYTNINPPFKWQYVSDVPEGAFPGYFTLLMAYSLAAEGALLSTVNPQLATFWTEKAEKQKGVAMNRDFTQCPSPRIQDMPIWQAHFTG